MEKDYTEVNVQKTKTEITLEAESVPGPMPVDESMVVEKPKKRRRRTVVPSLADNDATVPVNKELKINVEEVKEEDEQLQESVNKVMDKMRKDLGYPMNIDNLVDKKQLDSWKREFGEIYRTDLNDQVYIWHKLRRKDYIEVMSDESLNAIDNGDLRVFMRQEKILRKGVLYPSGEELEYLIDNNAGVAGNISDEIMLASGFRPVRSEKI
jgi:hypothetical protein